MTAAGASSRCAVCGGEYAAQPGVWVLTCSEKCHEQLVAALVERFGEHKKVVDGTTGTAHRVPTRRIIERGLRQEELAGFPEWKE